MPDEAPAFSGSWVGSLQGEQTVFEFTSGRMLMLNRGGADVVCTYKAEGGQLAVSETGGKTITYDIVSASDSSIVLRMGGGGEVSLVPLDQAEALQGDTGDAAGVDLALVGTALPASSKHLE